MSFVLNCFHRELLETLFTDCVKSVSLRIFHLVENNLLRERKKIHILKGKHSITTVQIFQWSKSRCYQKICVHAFDFLRT